MSSIVEKLINALGENIVISGDKMDRATSYWNSKPATAIALARPQTTEQVSQIIKICHENNHPIVTQAGMTNCVSAAEALPEEVILSLERMNKIESIDTTGSTATVGAGVILQTLQEACIDKDMIFPLDLGARGSCTIGGNAATNAGGINVLRYGMARNLILGMEVVLADGTILSSMNQMLKNNAAYDLKQLFIGTEGTLGVITRLVVKISPKPSTVNSALVGLDSFENVTSLLQKSQRELAGTLSAFEVMWGDHFRGVTKKNNDDIGHRAPMSRDYNYYVMMEAEGSDENSDTDRFMRLLENSFEQEIVVDAVIPKSETERIALWDIREDFEAILAPKPIFLYDVSLPIVDMNSYVKQVKAGLEARWDSVEFYVLGHIADGNLHFFIRCNDPLLSYEQAHFASDKIVYSPLKEYNGSVSAEHGIGMEKRDWLSYSRTEAELTLMKTLKRTLDPKFILNRGRVLKT